MPPPGSEVNISICPDLSSNKFNVVQVDIYTRYDETASRASETEPKYFHGPTSRFDRRNILLNCILTET